MRHPKSLHEPVGPPFHRSAQNCLQLSTFVYNWLGAGFGEEETKVNKCYPQRRRVSEIPEILRAGRLQEKYVDRPSDPRPPGRGEIHDAVRASDAMKFGIGLARPNTGCQRENELATMLNVQSTRLGRLKIRKHLKRTHEQQVFGFAKDRASVYRSLSVPHLPLCLIKVIAQNAIYEILLMLLHCSQSGCQLPKSFEPFLERGI